MQIVARGIAGLAGAKPEGEFQPVPRPFDITQTQAPIEAHGLDALAEFLKD